MVGWEELIVQRQRAVGHRSVRRVGRARTCGTLFLVYRPGNVDGARLAVRVDKVQRIVVVGAGLGGLGSVRALREQGFSGQLVLVGCEPHLPYDRPPLSKELLAGEMDDPTLEADWDELGVQLHLGRRAAGLRPGVVDIDGESLGFDGLVLATGASPVRLPGPGAQRVLRTVDEARSLRGALTPGKRIVIVGAGWIGAEVATAAAVAGCRVTVVEAGSAPLSANVGPEIGRYTERWYREAGIELRLGAPVAEVAPEGLVLEGGEVLPADEVLSAVGVRPEVGWLDGSGIEIDRGVQADERLRTSMPGVCAVGDCAAWWSTRFGARLQIQHWDNALRAPYVAAASLLARHAGAEVERDTGEAGQDLIYDPVPYFWSAQHGRMLQYVGYHAAADELIWRGDPVGEHWSVCWLRDGVLVAVLTVDQPRDLMQGRRAIAAAAPVDRERLADTRVRLRDALWSG